MEMPVQEGGDSGRPIVISRPIPPVQAHFKQLAQRVGHDGWSHCLTMLGGLRRCDRVFTPERARKRQRLREWILWGVPLAMVGVSGLLIASTQRQADYADWYHHWITAAVGWCPRLGP